MNALFTYVTTCRMVFQSDINDAPRWNDINRLIMYLRQSLTCNVCGQLLKIPMSSSVASCQHHVCKSCIGGKMRLKPSCSWCKDYSKFIENIQLRILLQCYKRLTLYIKRSEISKRWATLQTGNTPILVGSSANSIYNQNNCPANFKDLIDEASNLQDNYTFFEPPSLRNLNKSTNSDNLDNSKSSNLSSADSNDKILDKKQDDLASKPQATIVRLNASSHTSSNSIVNNQSVSSTHFNHQPNSSNLNNSPLNNQSANLTPIKSKQNQSTKQHKVRKGCRCGLATLNPGKLTCCGQRCPCYVEGKGCFDCKCRGCRNPNKTNNNEPQVSKQHNLIQHRTSPSFIQSTSSNNLTNASTLIPSSPNNLKLNNSTNCTQTTQTTLLSPASTTRNLLSPNFLLSSSSASSTALINNGSNVNQIFRNSNLFPLGTKINIISSTSSSPSSAILLSGHHNNVANVNESILFPAIENIDCIVDDPPTLHHQSINEIITVNENDVI